MSIPNLDPIYYEDPESLPESPESSPVDTFQQTDNSQTVPQLNIQPIQSIQQNYDQHHANSSYTRPLSDPGVTNQRMNLT
jgi:hypothetical protein